MFGEWTLPELTPSIKAATRGMHVYGLLHTEQYHVWCVDDASTDSLLQAATRGMHVYGLLHTEQYHNWCVDAARTDSLL